jgi:hypothetical protein
LGYHDFLLSLPPPNPRVRPRPLPKPMGIPRHRRKTIVPRFYIRKINPI